MSEWLKEHAWKACVGETLPWVRIPLSPPTSLRSIGGASGPRGHGASAALGPVDRIPDQARLRFARLAERLALGVMGPAPRSAPLTESPTRLAFASLGSRSDWPSESWGLHPARPVDRIPDQARLRFARLGDLRIVRLGCSGSLASAQSPRTLIASLGSGQPRRRRRRPASRIPERAAHASRCGAVCTSTAYPPPVPPDGCPHRWRESTLTATHSPRSASIGSTDAARRAGHQHANNATAARTPVVAAKVTGSHRPTA